MLLAIEQVSLASREASTQLTLQSLLRRDAMDVTVQFTCGKGKESDSFASLSATHMTLCMYNSFILGVLLCRLFGDFDVRVTGFVNSVFLCVCPPKLHRSKRQPLPTNQQKEDASVQ